MITQKDIKKVNSKIFWQAVGSIFSIRSTYQPPDDSSNKTIAEALQEDAKALQEDWYSIWGKDKPIL